jgi:hypothetical protein
LASHFALSSSSRLAVFLHSSAAHFALVDSCCRMVKNEIGAKGCETIAFMLRTNRSLTELE